MTIARVTLNFPILGRLLGPLLLASVGTGCGLIDANILDTDIHLQTQVYSQDFGMSTGTLPEVPCSSQADLCKAASDALANPMATASCDTAKGMCYAEATFNLTYKVNLSEEQAFQSAVGQKAVTAVRTIDLAYGLPINTLTVDIPEMKLYVGPQGAMTPADQGVVFIDRIPMIPARQTFPEKSRHILIADGSPARDQLVRNVMNPKVPFVFLLNSSPRVDGGDDLPGGKLELRLSPTITVGLPR